MSWKRKCKALYLRRGLSLLPKCFLGGATLVFLFFLHDLSAVHSHTRTSAHFVLHPGHVIPKLNFMSIRSEDVEHFTFTAYRRQQQLHGIARHLSNGTMRLQGDSSCRPDIVLKQSGEMAIQGSNPSQQKHSGRLRATKTKDSGAIQLKLTSDLTLDDRDSTGAAVRYLQLETLADWNGDLDGIDLRHLLHNLTAKQRQTWLALNLAKFRILQSDTISEAFSSRMDCFFGDEDAISCCNVECSARTHHVSEVVPCQDNERGKNDSGMESRISEEERLPQSSCQDNERAKNDSGMESGIKFSGEESLPQSSVDNSSLLQRWQVELPQKVPYDSRRRVESYDRGINRIQRGRKKCETRVFMTWIYPLSSFGPREQVSLESVFKTYPFACVVILSRSMDSEEGLEFLRPFRDRRFQVMAASPNFPFLLENTPALRWLIELREGNVDPGEISLSQNLSNLLRLAALYKYGGVYLDSDIIVMREFPTIDHVIGSQSLDPLRQKWTRINNAVMIFSRAHPVVFKFIEEFALTFNGTKWGHNGPYLVTRVWRRLMNRRGYECLVLPPVAFYPVNWIHLGDYMSIPKTEVERIRQAAMMGRIQRDSYTFHLWNKQSQDLEVERGSSVDVIFRQRCVFCDEGVLMAALKPQRRKLNLRKERATVP